MAGRWFDGAVRGSGHLERLLERSAAGDREAFAALYAATSAKLFGVVLRVLPERAEAEEVLQTAYLKIWRGAGRYEASRASPITWMAAIARNAAIDRARAERARGGAHLPVHGAAGEGLEEPGPSPEDAALRASDAGLLRRCLNELDERPAVALRFAFVAGLTYREIGAAMDVPENTVKSWVRRSLVRLRACMNRRSGGGGRAA